MASKQVIVMRQFPGLRTGKYVAQGAHGATGALLSISKHDVDNNCLIIPLHNPFVKEWILGRFTKVAVYVKTEQELLDLHKLAQAAGLPNALIQDAGLTEFGGVPTYTCLGIGPGDVDLINTITGKLPLF
jgi:PTH2 family peptidyl-tRNA hydrolase